MPFSCLVLAGGRSSRMGRDKASLVVDGKTLLERQLELAAACGAAERIVSLAAGSSLAANPGQGIQIAYDLEPDLGPVSGISAGLGLATLSHCLVVAVDLPEVRLELLEAMWAATGVGNSAAPGSTRAVIPPGIVPRLGDQLEPLLAIYPSQAAAALARERLVQRKLSATQFAQAAFDAGLVRLWDVPESFGRCFTNWNRPGDWYPQSPGRSAQRYY